MPPASQMNCKKRRPVLPLRKFSEHRLVSAWMSIVHVHWVTSNVELTARAVLLRCSSRPVPRRPLNEGLGDCSN